MTNQQVGQVYAKIINEVCDASQTDFEEGGVDQKTLDLLKTTWQKKLSYLNIAHFPWDPPPAQPAPPPAQHPPPQAVPSNVSRPPPPQPLPSNGAPQQAPASASNVATPRVKPEPGSYPVPPTVPQQQNGYNPQQPMGNMSGSTPQQRAAQALHQKFGAQAGPQIAQLQQQSAAALALPGQRYQGVQLPGQSPNQDQKPPPGVFQPPQTPQQQKTPVSAAQTDGSGDAMDDWKAEVERRRAAIAQDGGESDRLLREHVLAKAQRMEGGGLMVPLDQKHFVGQGTKRKVVPPPSELPAQNAGVNEVGESSTSANLKRAQMDGADDDDDEDEKPDLDDADAINSDLDDPEDAEAGGDDEDETPQVMLCTYDKVQRVKNKWKCTMKDGILFVGGKEYVFHKGQGEFEW